MEEKILKVDESDSNNLNFGRVNVEALDFNWIFDTN